MLALNRLVHQLGKVSVFHNMQKSQIPLKFLLQAFEVCYSISTYPAIGTAAEAGTPQPY